MLFLYGVHGLDVHADCEMVIVDTPSITTMYNTCKKGHLQPQEDGCAGVGLCSSLALVVGVEDG